MLRRSFMTIALVVSPMSISAMQAGPDFSGHWVSSTGHELVIAQYVATLRVDESVPTSRETYDALGRRVDSTRISTTYRLDGSAVVTTVRGQTIHSRLTWTDGSLYLRDVVQGDARGRIERRLSLDDRGRLVLVRLQPADTHDEPASSSADILNPRRIVFEKK